ncbi:MAG: response regulator [Candidatus Marinimicrobia bacterium]|nr:response regulator [Candidatus Neomarinimicrobiota bacterium]
MQKIYLIDDDDSFLELLKNFFEEQQFEVFTNLSGENIIPDLMKFEPDIVLLDVSMPGTNGFDILRQIRTNVLLSMIPIIMVTGESDPNSQIEGLTSGAEDYIVKPFDLNVLYARVLKTLQKTIVKTRTKFDQINLLASLISIYKKRNYQIFSKLMENYENYPPSWEGFIPDLIIVKKDKIRAFQFESAQSILDESFIKRMEELSDLRRVNPKIEPTVVVRSRETMHQTENIAREYGYKIKFKLIDKKFKKTEYLE